MFDCIITQVVKSHNQSIMRPNCDAPQDKSDAHEDNRKQANGNARDIKLILIAHHQKK